MEEQEVRMQFSVDDVRQIVWSSTLYSPHDIVSQIFPLFVKIESGSDENLNLKPNQVIRLEKYDKQKRILIKDQRSRHLTVPRNFPMKFVVKNSHTLNSKKKKTLKQFKGAKLKYIIRQYFNGIQPLLLDFEYTDPWKFKIGSEITNSREFGSIFLETINTSWGPVSPKITEHFLKGHFLTREYFVITDRRPIAIPTTCNLKLRVAEGFLGDESGLKWKEFQEYARRQISRSLRSNFFTDDGTMDILIPDMTSLPKHLNYDFSDNESTTTIFSEQTQSGITNGSQKMFNSYNTNGSAVVHSLDEATNEMAILTVESEKVRVDEDNNDVTFGTMKSRKFEEQSEKIEREILESITRSEDVVDVQELYSSVDRKMYKNKAARGGKIETREEGIQTAIDTEVKRPEGVVERNLNGNKSEISLTVSKDEDHSTLRRYQKANHHHQQQQQQQQPNFQNSGYQNQNFQQSGLQHQNFQYSGLQNQNFQHTGPQQTVTTMPRIVRRLKPNDYQSTLPRQQPVVYLQKAHSASNLLVQQQQQQQQQPIYLAQNQAGLQTAYVLQPIQLGGGQPLVGQIGQPGNGGHVSVLQVGNGMQRAGSMPSLYSQPVQAVNLQRAKSPGPASVRVVNM
ncbi:DgyrCDS7962 [Dimorphilus gyrociliatus]|uniref:DgyrCDS7962 n=1 Tax=Dimorphilus gyrociliatus TaxID=2664684 RepID=A0A7I8VSR4_9ANNE|nr:DgyrCDS7962 [Dimorphilus gyrociliatus]